VAWMSSPYMLAGLALSFAGIASLATGALDWLLHFTLRVILWARCGMPWRYSRFLDHAADCILLRKVGGGYIFIHRLLLEYFQHDPRPATSSSPPGSRSA